MQRHRKWWITVIAVTVSLVVACGSARATAPRFGPKLITQEESFKVVSYQYAPLVDAQTPGYGMAAAIVQAALQEGNLPAEMEILPARSLAKRSILYDGAPALLAPKSLFTREELAKLVVLPCVTAAQAYYFYEPAHREWSGFRGDVKTLKGFRLGVVKGEEVQRQGELRVSAEEPRLLLRRVQEGALDLVLLPELVQRHLTRNYHAAERGNFKALGSAEGVNFTLLVNPKDPRRGKIETAYLKGMDRIRKNGKLAQIVALYESEGSSSGETYRPSLPQGGIEFGSSDTPPFYAPNLPGDGMAGEIVHAIFDEMHMQSLIRYFPLKRLYTDRHNNHLGDPDNFSGQQFSAIVPIALYRPAFFYYAPRHPQGMRFRSARDLKGYRIGVLRGTVEDRDYFKENAISVSEADSEQSLLLQLKEGRIDLCGVVRETGEYTAKKLFPREAHQFVALDFPKAASPITIMIGADYPDGKRLGERVNEAFNRILKNGTYQRIVTKYYGGKVPAEWYAELERFRGKYRQEGGNRAAQ